MTDARGFTLVEMLVSMAIFGVITGFVMANYRVGQQGDELRIAAELVANELRRAQTNAIGGAEATFCSGGDTEGAVCSVADPAACPNGTCVRDLPRGYGVRFSVDPSAARRMYFFADTDGDRLYAAQERLRDDGVAPGQAVLVTGLEPIAGNTLDITFAPPKPTVFYNGDTSVTEARITLTHPATGQTRTVRVNRISGQVSTE